MSKETTLANDVSLAELKNHAMALDRAEMWDLYGRKEGNEDYNCRGHMLVMNMDKAAMACIARKNYVVIQHRHAVESVVDAISSLNIKSLATMKVSRHGVQVDLNFPDVSFELKNVGEKFTCGMRLHNDYSQQSGLVIAPRVNRLVCSNGMIISEVVKPRRIKWTEQLNVELEGLIDKLIKDIISSDERLANKVSDCIGDSVEWKTMNLLLRFMFKNKKHIKELIARLPMDKEKITRWDFYNSVTNYATHGKRLKPEVDAWLHNKANEIMKNNFTKLCEVQIPQTEEELRIDSVVDSSGE